MKFYGELLVFILLFLTNFRVFFVHHVKRDPLVMLAPFTFLIAILQIFAWGVDAFTLFGLFLALLVLLSNFHALFRYMEALYVDHYSPLMKTWAIFTSLFSVLAVACTIYFAPVEKKNFDLEITETQMLYKGSFRSGFEKADPFNKKNLFLTKFSPSENNGNSSDIIVLLMPDKRADTINYKPYLQELAVNGITVYSADFYTDDGKWLHAIGDARIMRRLAMTCHSVLNNQWFMGQREYYTYNISQEYNALLPILEETSESGFDTSASQALNHRFFLITDVMANTAAADLQKKNPDKIAGILELDSIEDYKTAGYGMVEQTDPLLAAALGTKRDSSLKTPKVLARATLEALNDLK